MIISDTLRLLVISKTYLVVRIVSRCFSDPGGTKIEYNGNSLDMKLNFKDTHIVLFKIYNNIFQAQGSAPASSDPLNFIQCIISYSSFF